MIFSIWIKGGGSGYYENLVQRTLVIRRNFRRLAVQNRQVRAKDEPIWA
ncbi:MAG: hypothetical protein LUQ38_05225 [Methanotrichaceae archaeon]|nr:hypothetical protein [Methanotrichaceae archaeon]